MRLLEEKINTAISLKNILFATDFSDVSEGALPYAAAMSLRYGGMVHVAHVLPETILVLLGSVAEEIFRHATCPVFTVGPRVPKLSRSPVRRHDAELAPAKLEFRHILYATDFTPHSLAGASYAFSLAREFRTRLTLLHVIEEYGSHLYERPGQIDAALRKLEDLTPEEAGLRYAPEPAVEFGAPADRILQAAADRDADLIVLGVRPDHVDASTHLPWATAHKVVAGAKCPVLTVRG